MIQNFVLLMGAPQGKEQGGWMSLLPLVLIMVVFYFFMIRPQMKKQKEAKKYVENIKKGDKVVTIGGIIGKIIDMQENAIIIETEGGTKLKVLKSAISMENSATLNAGSAS
jgi:preprotein translocase subunit YajC